MRITETTAAYHSIIWFACDPAGHIILADSREGCIPTFVANDEARTTLIANKLCGLQAIDRQRQPPIDFPLLASQGFYCFINDDPFDGTLYRLCAKPQKPRLISELEPNLRQLLCDQMLPINADDCDCFSIDR